MCILVVEDDFLIRMILVEELMDAGFDVKEASNGDEAVGMLGDIGSSLAVLVTDIHMPGSRSGLDVASHLHARHPDVPVIFTTGRPDALMGLSNLQDWQHLIRKPYVPDEIVARVQMLLAAE